MKILNIIFVAVFVAVAICGGVLGEDPKYPDIGTTYSTYVSVNEYIHGYTIAMKEYHNMAKNSSRFEGEHIIVADWSSQAMIYWNASQYISNGDSECFIDQEIMKSQFHLRPTYTWFNSLNNSTFVKTDVLKDRNIECNQFSMLLNAPGTETDIFCGDSATFSTIDLTEVNTFVNTTGGQCSFNSEGDVNVVCKTTPEGGSICDFSYQEKSVTPAPSEASSSSDASSSSSSKASSLSEASSSSSSPETTPETPNSVNKLLMAAGDDITMKTLTCNRNTKADLTKLGTIVGTKKDTPCNSTVTTTFNTYFDSKTSVPIRFTLLVEKVIQNDPVKQVLNNTEIDMVDWINDQSQQDSLYYYNGDCKTKEFPSLWNLPTEKHLFPVKDYKLDIARWSLLFEPVMNGELQESFEWKNDIVNGFESFEFDRPTGDIIRIINGAQKSNYIVNTLTMECQFPDSQEQVTVFDDPRKLAVKKALVESDTFNWTSQAMTKRRNVDVYPWTTSDITVGLSKFNVTVYTFAPGWAFPGRIGVTQDTIVPQAVEVQFTVDDKTAVDIWDIYFFVPTYIPYRYTSVLELGCAPILPIQYSAVVNIEDVSHGHTTSFKEISDKVKVYTFTQGKFNNYNTMTLLDSANLLQWNASACSKFDKASLGTAGISLDSFDSSIYYYFNFKFNLTQDKTIPMQYIGNSSLVRSPNAKAWKKSTGEVLDKNGNTVETDITFYWAPSSNASIPVKDITASYTPVRVVIYTVTKSATGAINTHNTIVDWAQFNSTIEEKIAYPECTQNVDTAPYVNSEPTVEYATPKLDANSTRPLLPSNFTAYIEIKTKVPGTNTVKTNYVLWEYSRERLAESITYYYENGTNDVFSFCYFNNMGSQGNFTKNNQSLGVGTTQSTPLYGADGALVNFFNNVDYLRLAVLNPTYDTVRGIDSEKWSLNSTSKNYIASIIWYPANWTSNNVEPGVRVPIRLTRNNDNTATGNIVETWDVFGFSTTISPQLYSKCVANVSVKTDKTISKGATIAIVVIIAVFAVGMIALAITIIKKRGGISRKQPPHILLDDRNLINQSDNERLYEN
ncbi:hypothetical protein CYY_001491 [Polysphondylium violaceum]|uniref:Uncharacterized protein n=1 Tax=Polysphondylium violaceum TaxID=133409 RepID=A0A8J4V7W9_9MYCE|nr:hypothetical protein CYY_001491 [Polysphondylium violaceum]